MRFTAIQKWPIASNVYLPTTYYTVLRGHKVYQKMRWKGTKKPDVSRVLPLPQGFKATEKSKRNVTFKTRGVSLVKI